MASEEVCIVLRPYLMPLEYVYYIYIVHISDLVEKETDVLWRHSLALRIHEKAPSDIAFAVRDSTLYMFRSETKSFSYALSSRDTPVDIDLFKDDDVKLNLKPISPMISPKILHCAVKIGRKICVFSRLLKPDMVDHFELYDPDSDEWSPVPLPPLDLTPCRHRSGRGKDYLSVYYYYVENLQLFITTEKGSFRIDFGSQEPHWSACNFPKLEKKVVLRLRQRWRLGGLALLGGRRHH